MTAIERTNQFHDEIVALCKMTTYQYARPNLRIIFVVDYWQHQFEKKSFNTHAKGQLG